MNIKQLLLHKNQQLQQHHKNQQQHLNKIIQFKLMVQLNKNYKQQIQHVIYGIDYLVN